MTDVILIALLVMSSGAVGTVLLRSVASRRVQARQERLKEHLDWINPPPRKRRARPASRG